MLILKYLEVGTLTLHKTMVCVLVHEVTIQTMVPQVLAPFVQSVMHVLTLATTLSCVTRVTMHQQQVCQFVHHVLTINGTILVLKIVKQNLMDTMRFILFLLSQIANTIFGRPLRPVASIINTSLTATNKMVNTT
jgi:hypothetical protein